MCGVNVEYAFISVWPCCVCVHLIRVFVCVCARLRQSWTLQVLPSPQVYECVCAVYTRECICVSIPV